MSTQHDTTGDTTRPDRTPPGRGRRTLLISVGAALAAVLLLAGLTFVLMRLTSEDSGPDPGLRAAYDSAMAKAGVSATMPAEPVALGSVEPYGLHSFEATFTPQEVAALLEVYPYAYAVNGSDVTLSNVDLEFPSNDTVSLRAAINIGSDTYSVRLTAPVVWSATGLSSTGITELRVEGVEPNTAQRSAASSAVVAYFNSLIRAAPGLVVREARITPAGLHVAGDAPDALEHPAP